MAGKQQLGRISGLSPRFVWARLLLLLPLALVPFRVESAQPVVVQVEMTEFAFHPSVVRLAAGRLVTLVLVNHGLLAHQFETAYLRTVPTLVTDDTMHVETFGTRLVRLQPGIIATITFLTAVRGRVPFACTIEGHREAGMVGVLDVR